MYCLCLHYHLTSDNIKGQSILTAMCEDVFYMERKILSWNNEAMPISSPIARKG